jgi:hypothetical protein
MKSPVKLKLMRILLDGQPHLEIDLATGAGFTRVATIRKLLDSFERARFITRRKDPGSGWYCQLNLSRETILKVYNHPEFRMLRPALREQSWFCPLFTGSFDTLPDPLPDTVRQMVVQSHSFFEIISRYDSPEKIRETFKPLLLLNRMASVTDPVFDDHYLFYLIFVQAVIRDIEYGGLGTGFAGLLDESQKVLVASFANTGRDAKGHSYVDYRTKRLL